MRRAALAFTAGLGVLHGAGACTLPADAGQRVDTAAVQLAWRPLRGPIVVSRPFELQVTLCPAEAQLMRVDATMPEHRHGMNYRPSVTAIAPGRWQVQGMLWHMTGRWELRFDVDLAGASHTLSQGVEVR